MAENLCVGTNGAFIGSRNKIHFVASSCPARRNCLRVLPEHCALVYTEDAAVLSAAFPKDPKSLNILLWGISE